MTKGFATRVGIERFQHPEAQPGEVLIGNIYAADFNTIGWTTKRLGRMAFSNGTPLGIGNLRLLFVARSEIEAHRQRQCRRD